MRNERACPHCVVSTCYIIYGEKKMLRIGTVFFFWCQTWKIYIRPHIMTGGNACKKDA